MTRYTLSLLIFITIFQQSCQPAISETNKKPQSFAALPSVDFDKNDFKMRGLSFVAPPRPFTTAAMTDVKSVNADWIAVIPYGFTRPNTATVNYHKNGWGWWGERPEGVQVTIDSAHRAGIHVMLKPQVFVPGGWTGGLDFKTDAEWEQWEKGYEEYIMTFVDIAQSMQAEMLCIGTEFKIGVVKRETFWRNLIKKIREKYKGKLIYAANWDEYPLVPFWDALDGIGINAYFPLVQKETPSVDELKTAWKPIFNTIKDFSKKHKKPVVFTEYGYLSVDGCTYNSWEVEKRVREVKINQQAQANAIDALFATFWSESWWQGGFLWKWFPEGQGHEGYFERDYTPQGKIAQKVLTQWYGKK